MMRPRCEHRGVCSLLVAVAAVLSLLVPGGCAPGTFIGGEMTSPLDVPQHGWVIVVYMSADNELEGQAIEDINEMEAASLAGSGVTVLAFIDRSPGHDNSNGDWTGTRLYEIVEDPDGVDDTISSIPRAVPDLGVDPAGDDVELNMGDPETLAKLLDRVAELYQPRRLALILWGHGSGFRDETARPGADSDGWRVTGFDDTSGGDALFTAELASACTGHSIDLIGFDTCFGASIEAAYELRERATWMVASQDVEPADGWEYTELLDAFARSDLEPESLADAITQSYATSYSGVGNATISTVDLRCVDDVVGALNEFAEAVRIGAADSATRDAVRSSLFYDVEDFYATPGDLSIDVGDMARVVGADYGFASEEAAALEDAVARAVRSSWSGSANPDATGVSVHLIPLEADGTASPVHDEAYIRGGSPDHPLAFVADSLWPPQLPDGDGLLYRLFYEVME